MILEGLHEKEIFTENIPFRIAINTEEIFDYPLHWHNAVELIYVLQGFCMVYVNNAKYILHEKDILIIAPGDIHSFHISNSKGIRYFIQFDFTKLLGFSETIANRPYHYSTNLISFTDNNELHTETESHLIKIIDEYNNIGFDCDLFFTARFLDITIILSRKLFNKVDNQVANNRPFDLVKLDKAFRFIEENYSQQISLKDVSKATGFSEYHFSRFFKKTTEKNFHRYLNEYRIKKAEILIFNNVSIADAAYTSGFNSIVTFNRIFKQLKGCSPTEYIKKRV
jgi:AraC-like DNA-binding protein